ncbi:MAG: endonuclease III [Candidatus Doudnabacteria bacterium Gr01-1014_77]|uniref:Endonuclease III n=1 Tax=Candidatus Doudnabacteria bacterium Gr01-1014_77 TaxID=2017133 RepID=A0A554JBE0_9BACT|nr:MAG: endonuclease III [Candidatus Doudnabacteria bacterium Gr01-1014_77]
MQNLKIRAKNIKRELDKLFPNPTTSLIYKTPFQLLIATILSAQCTDALVNKVTEPLFKKYKTPKDLANANINELTKDIHSVTFYKNKAKMIQKTSKIIHEQYKDKVPKEKNLLIKLPGVGSKTANVVLGHAFGITSGFVVDTHIKRVAKRLGLTKHTDPAKIERELMQIVPEKDWITFADQLLWLGRKYCTARKDKCIEHGLKLTHYSK